MIIPHFLLKDALKRLVTLERYVGQTKETGFYMSPISCLITLSEVFVVIIFTLTNRKVIITGYLNNYAVFYDIVVV